MRLERKYPYMKLKVFTRFRRSEVFRCHGLCAWGSVFIILFFFAGCSPKYMEESADKEVYAIIEAKKMEIAADELQDMDRGVPEKSIIFDLREAIIRASASNRDYQSRREDVYLNILNLTYKRYEFRNRYTLGGSFDWQGGGNEDGSAGGSLNMGFLRWLSTGAEITLDISKDFLRYLTGDKRTDIQTIISLNLLQPLIRGAGREIAQEGLIQAERDAIYEIRSFLRYQKEFSVEVADRYLNLLRLNNRKENFFNNYESLKRTRERIEMLADAGRMPAIQVDQAKQNEYDAHQRWLTSVNSYNSALDNFKIFLGLNSEAQIGLDGKLLQHFIETGITGIDVELEDFLAFALSRRMDLLTRHDRLEDARRKVKVAQNDLRTQLNLNVGINASTEESSSPTVDFQAPSYTSGLDLDLPIDNLSERNQYKQALISLKRAERDFENKTDTVRLEVAQQYRNLEEAYQSYLIQQRSMELASQRIESINLLLEAGRAAIRDLLEAEDAYLNAQNTLADEVVKYTIAYLRFLYLAESLEVDDNGVWKGDIYEKVTKKNIQE